MNQQARRIRGKLALDKHSAWIGGVCAGIARYLNIEPIYVRGGVVIVGVFLTKTVIVAYILLWLLLYRRRRRTDQA